MQPRSVALWLSDLHLLSLGNMTESASIKIRQIQNNVLHQPGNTDRDRLIPEKTEILNYILTYMLWDLYLGTILCIVSIVRIEVWKTNPNHRLLVFPSIYIHFIWYFYRFHICNIFKTFSSSRFLHCALHLQIEYWNPAILTGYFSSWRVPTGPSAVSSGKRVPQVCWCCAATVVQFEVTDSHRLRHGSLPSSVLIFVLCVLHSIRLRYVGT